MVVAGEADDNHRRKNDRDSLWDSHALRQDPDTVYERRRCSG